MSQTFTGILKKAHFKGIKLCFSYSCQAWKCLWYLFKFCAFFPQWSLLIYSSHEGILQFPLIDQPTFVFPVLALGSQCNIAFRRALSLTVGMLLIPSV